MSELIPKNVRCIGKHLIVEFEKVFPALDMQSVIYFSLDGM